jgi:iron complex outermembrane recepter protein
MKKAIRAAFLCAAVSAWAGTATGQAAAAEPVALNISTQGLAQALAEFAVQADLRLVYYSELGDGLQAPAVVGRYTPAAALRLLLAHTPLRANFVDAHTVVIRADAVDSSTNGQTSLRIPDGPVLTTNTNATRLASVSDAADVGPPSQSNDSSENESGDESNKKLEQIVVTGSHIRGSAPVGSPVTIYDRDTIDQSGAATLAQFAQTMTENFGSTSPVATYGSNSIGFDQTSSNGYGGSGFNLHGIGSGATLTLINGQRVSGGGIDGSFVDVSTIPLSAVDRIEVLSDGGSAVYGADAVAGVVNIILKKNYDGAETSLRDSYPTRGGGQEKTVSQLVGKSWQTGDLMGVYEYDRQDAIEQTQRAFIPIQAYPGAIVPADKRQSFLLSGHQQVLDDKTSLNGSLFYGSRDSDAIDGGNIDLFEATSHVKQYAENIDLHHDFSGGWSAGIGGNMSKAQESQLGFFPQFSFSNPLLTNTQIREAVLQADGPLFSLGERSVKAALGTGFRTEQVDSTAAGAATDTELTRHVSYLYGELLFPFVGPSQSIAFIDKLELSLAGRYDRYSDFGSSTNPKVGLMWSPVAALAVRGSYSKSFRPPALTQLAPFPEYYAQFEPNSASPAGQTDTLISQSPTNPNLLPEKATSYTGGLDFRPSSIPSLSVSTTYFRLDFKNRIESPPIIGNAYGGTANIFQQPALSPFIVPPPSPSEVAAIFSGPGFYGDEAGGGPSAVQALFNASLTNIAKTVQSGIEEAASYKMTTRVGDFSWSIAATYFLQNKYIATSTAPAISLLNILGEPPRLRTRAGLTWSDWGWTSSTFVNYTNSYQNPLFTPSQDIACWTTVDWQVTYRLADHLGFTEHSGLKVALSVQNLFDRDPPRVAFPPVAGGGANVGFDALNASPFGRTIALQITKAW